jgi:hypothetical protein
MKNQRGIAVDRLDIQRCLIKIIWKYYFFAPMFGARNLVSDVGRMPLAGDPPFIRRSVVVAV